MDCSNNAHRTPLLGFIGSNAWLDYAFAEVCAVKIESSFYCSPMINIVFATLDCCMTTYTTKIAEEKCRQMMHQTFILSPSDCMFRVQRLVALGVSIC